ncbi:bifunctional glucose-1-phosphatase/inositol phosphatase [Herbaspirillum rhizosphaerae]|uniref:bifunctional glucose-1-phosphatase/inositol phosphatase n=1 Tax=Herbaspirillum rhizosphaerae TaxID=346179 RepID=UPI000A4FD22D|nr:bifunctional glucose-1-phosphatase/inositol phosphatase [Herbaspirillum rhizosphaerae]
MIPSKMICLMLPAILALPSGLSAQPSDGNLQLQQVLMLSRHNLRAPLSDNGSVLDQSTRKRWPQWEVQGGYLTAKGGVLAVYMGHYTREWLVQQGLAKKSECPTPDDVFVYANSLQRTVATAQFFVAGAFPGCDIAVTHQPRMGTMDPTFNPVVVNDSATFNQAALAAMQKVEADLHLKPAYQRLEKIISYKDSAACEGKKDCSLSGGMQNKFSADIGKEPSVSGPLKVGNSMMDAFTLQYYQGFPAEQIAWGEIKTPEQWRELSAIKNGYQDALFASPLVAREVAAPLLAYIRKSMTEQNRGSAPKVTLMVGHDSNVASLLSTLDFKAYDLPEQNEKTPIGGMIVFERWRDANNNKDLMKVEYVYQSTSQLRDAQPLSMANPPKRVTLQMNACPTDAKGYCAWDTFVQVLNGAQKGAAGP